MQPIRQILFKFIIITTILVSLKIIHSKLTYSLFKGETQKEGPVLILFTSKSTISSYFLIHLQLIKFSFIIKYNSILEGSVSFIKGFESLQEWRMRMMPHGVHPVIYRKS